METVFFCTFFSCRLEKKFLFSFCVFMYNVVFIMFNLWSLNLSLSIVLLLANDTAHVLECLWFVNFHSWLDWRASSFVSLQNFSPFSVIIRICIVRFQLKISLPATEFHNLGINIELHSRKIKYFHSVAYFIFIKVLKLSMVTHKRVSTYSTTDQLIKRGCFPVNGHVHRETRSIVRESFNK